MWIVNMDAKLIIVFAATLTASTTALPPCSCTRNLTPVCGSDGNTYNNECLMNCAGTHLTVVRHEPCDSLLVVNNDEVKVVNDLVTVVNEAYEQPPCICPALLTPVCGTDGNTYSNKCEMKCAGKDTMVVKEGLCDVGAKIVNVPSVQVACTCVRNYKPVCGSDNETYPNECLLRCADKHLTVAREGSCDGENYTITYKDVDEESVSLPPCICTRNLKPVCASNGVTYANECLMRCAGKHLTVTFKRPCEGESSPIIIDDIGFPSQCSNACSRKLAPVCGSDGNSYNNDCLLRCSGRDVTMAHEGQCDDKVKVVDISSSLPLCTCTRNLRPVCGVDGVTYNNLCLLKCAGKEMKSQGPCESDQVKVVD